MKQVLTWGLLFVTLFCLGVYGWFQYDYYQHPYWKRQVRAVPQSVTDPKSIEINRHLMLTSRPAEIFPFPISLGEVGPAVPLYAGQRQYPFFCMTEDSRLGQPQVDNQEGLGVAVYRETEDGRLTDEIIGYSKDCGLPSKMAYWYVDRHGKLHPWHSDVVGEEIAQVDWQGETLPEIYRIESGTINRFPYFIVMLAAPGSSREDARYWSGRLIYQFHGGSGIGFRQGRLKASKVVSKLRDQLRRGDAVISSTGNKTSYTYNMLLAEDTARRVKQQFTSLYGSPRFTIGIGGSGGGLTQYLFMQNRAGVLDGALALYSYPDMVSQTLYALDCDLLNTYYAFRSREPDPWENFDYRPQIEGLNAAAGFDHPAPFLQPLNQLLSGRWPSWPGGSSECINGWFGLSALHHNPNQGYLRPMFSQQVKEETHWSYWEDLHQVYGRNELGYARSAWDNQGVQYGLQALRDGELSLDDFIDLNRKVGGWLPAQRMEKEKIYTPLGSWLPLWLSLWSHHNVSKGSIASRTVGDPLAVEQAYRTGQVFLGHNPLPVLDLRHYLEDELDMHHLSASFETRARIQQWHGHNENQVIWVAHQDYTPVQQAFDAMERWLVARSLGQSRPEELKDSCFDKEGGVIASGTGVWDGNWNRRVPGPCSEVYPAYTNARIQAGGPWSGSIFQCQKIPVEQAVDEGFYGEVAVKSRLTSLQKIFPEGVCDYRRGDQGRPADLVPDPVTGLVVDASGLPGSGDHVQGDSQAMTYSTGQHEQVPDGMGIPVGFGSVEQGAKAVAESTN